MFEKLIESVLQDLLSDYVDGLNAQSLKVGIWRGEAQVENLKLKPDALKNLGFPLLVKFSKLGTLKLNIPWKNLASAPLILNLDTLHIVLELTQPQKSTVMPLSPEQKLNLIEQFRQSLIEKMKEKKEGGLKDRIIIRVIENIQLIIQNIHVRFEDTLSSKPGCCYGLILKRLHCLTVDEKGQETFLDRTLEANKNSNLIKALKIDNFGFYWSTEYKRFNPAQLEQQINEQDYLFKLNLDLLIIQPPKTNQYKEYRVVAMLDNLELQCSNLQFHQAMKLMSFLTPEQTEKEKINPLSQRDRENLMQIYNQAPIDKLIGEAITKNDLNVLYQILSITDPNEAKAPLIQILKEQYIQYQQDNKKQQQNQGKIGWIFGKWNNKKQQEVAELSNEETENINKFLVDNFQVEEEKQTILLKSMIIIKQGRFELLNPRNSQQMDTFVFDFSGMTCLIQKYQQTQIKIELNDSWMLVKSENQKLYQERINQQGMITKEEDEIGLILQYQQKLIQQIFEEQPNKQLYLEINVTNISIIFYEKDYPLLRLSIIKNNVKFIIHNNQRKDIFINMQAIEGCVYQQINNKFYQDAIIGAQKAIEIPENDLQDLKSLMKYFRIPEDEEIKIEVALIPSQKKETVRLKVILRELQLTLHTSSFVRINRIIMNQITAIQLPDNLNEYTKPIIQNIQKQYNESLTMLSEKQVIMKLENVKIVIPFQIDHSYNQQLLILQGKFNILLNIYDDQAIKQQLHRQIFEKKYQDNQQNVKLTLNLGSKSLEGFITSKLALGDQQQILFPTDINVDFEESYHLQQDFSAIDTIQKIKCNIGQTVGNLSMTKIQLIQDIANYQLDLLRQFSEDDLDKLKQEQQKQIKETKQKEDIVRRYLTVEFGGLKLKIQNDYLIDLIQLVNMEISSSLIKFEQQIVSNDTQKENDTLQPINYIVAKWTLTGGKVLLINQKENKNYDLISFDFTKIAGQLINTCCSISVQDVWMIYQADNDNIEPYKKKNPFANQINQSNIAIKDDSLKKKGDQFNLNVDLTNFSIFICQKKIPLLRFSILQNNFQYDVKQDNRKNILVKLLAIDGCVFNKINNTYIQQSIIGNTKEFELTQSQIEDLDQLIGYCGVQEQELMKIELSLYEKDQFNELILNIILGKLILTMHTQKIVEIYHIMMQLTQINIPNKVEAYANKQIKVIQQQYSENLSILSQKKISLNLENVQIVIPAQNNEKLILQGKFSVNLELNDAEQQKESLLKSFKQQKLEQSELQLKMGVKCNISQFEAFLSSEKNKLQQIIYPIQLNLLFDDNFKMTDRITTIQNIKLSSSDITQSAELSLNQILFLLELSKFQLALLQQFSNNQVVAANNQLTDSVVQALHGQQEEVVLRYIKINFSGFKIQVLNDLQKDLLQVLNLEILSFQVILEQQQVIKNQHQSQIEQQFDQQDRSNYLMAQINMRGGKSQFVNQKQNLKYDILQFDFSNLLGKLYNTENTRVSFSVENVWMIYQADNDKIEPYKRESNIYLLQDQSKIKLNEKNLKEQNDQLNFNLELTNFSIFICQKKMPLLRFSILQNNIQYIANRNRKNITISLYAIDGCIYTIVQGQMQQQTIIGKSEDRRIQLNEIQDLEQLSKYCGVQEQEQMKIHINLLEKQNKNIMKVDISFGQLLLTLHTQELIKVYQIANELTQIQFPNILGQFANQQIEEIQKQYEQNLQIVNEKQILIQLQSVTLVLPSSKFNNAKLTLQGKFSLILNLFDTMSIEELLQYQIEHRLSQYDIQNKNVKINLSFNSENLELFINSTTNIQERRQIIFPSNMLINYKDMLVLSDDQNFFEKRSEIRGSLSKNISRFGLSDIIFLTSSIQEQLASIQMLVPQQPQQLQIAQQLPSTKELTTQRYEIIFEGLEVKILNDLSNQLQYLLDFKMQRWELLMQQQNQSSTISFLLPIELNYFNCSLSNWEPILEQAQFQFLYFQTFGNLNSSLQIILQQTTNVNINFTTQLFQTLYQAKNLLMNSWNKQNVNIVFESQTLSAYQIQNLLGVNVLCITGEQEPQFMIVENMQRKNFDIKMKQNQNLLTFQIQSGLKQEEISSWNIDRLKSRKYQRVNDFYIISNQINNETNQKMITLSSEYLIKNLTQYTFDIVLLNSQKETIKQTLQKYDKKEQHNFTPIPNGYVQFYISRRDQLGSKSQVVSLNYLKSHENMPQDIWLNKDFIVMAKLTQEKEIPGRFTIYLLPLLRIVNILPFPIQFQYMNVNEKLQAILYPNDFYDDHAPYKENKQIILVANHYQPSINIELRRVKEQQSQLIIMNGIDLQGYKSGGKSDIYIEYQNDSFSYLPYAYIYSPLYAVNETEYDLLMYQGAKGYKLLGGQKESTQGRGIILNQLQDQEELVFAHRNSPTLLSNNAINLNQMGASYGELIYQKQQNYRIAPLVAITEFEYKENLLIKIKRIRHRVIILNECLEPLALVSDMSELTITPNQRTPLELEMRKINLEQITTSDLLQFRISLIDSYNWSFTGIIDFNQLNNYSAQLRSQKYQTIRKFIQININQTNGCIFVVVSEIKHDQAPYKITNRSNLIEIDVPIIGCKLGTNDEGFYARSDPMKALNQIEVAINPKVQNYYTQVVKLDLDKIRIPRFIHIKNQDHREPQIIIKYQIHIESYTKHIIFSDSNIDEGDEQKIAKEMQKQQQELLIKNKFDIQFNQICISIINNHCIQPKEILQITIQKAESLLIIDSKNKLIFQFRVSYFQLDNQSIIYPNYPVLLSVLPKQKTNDLPIINFYFQKNLDSYTFDYIEKITLEINNIFLCLEDQIFNEISSMANSLLKITQTQQDQQQKSVQLFNWQQCELPPRVIPTFIGQIIILPIIIQVTFSFSKMKQNKDLFSQMIAGVGLQLVNIDQAEIKLKGWKLEDCYGSFSNLLDKLSKTYISNIKQQLPILLGSLSIIGNPVKLLKSVSTGINDFVEKPIEGFTKGPIEGGLGVVDGTTSLVSNTVAGTFNTVKVFGGAISSGLTKITMDDDYLTQRQIQNQKQAKNVADGIAEGGMSLAKGIAGGVMGFFTKPVQGAQQQGVEGFAKGFWKGTTGLVIKPVTGVLDVITKTSEGMKNQLDKDQGQNYKRFRQMRPFYEVQGYIKDYNENDAFAYELLKKIKKGALSNENYYGSYYFEKDKKIFILLFSESSVILYNRTQNIKHWIIKLVEIVKVNRIEQVLQITVNHKKKSFQNNTMTNIQFKSSEICKNVNETLKSSLDRVN